ncbi:conserved hypothetical protein [Ferrimonas balearica DSM 9799]|uniref:Acid-resistance membrane protein n=1 Tax=Ferrimonas balearica (strain DSM 9799 / CCM 4581 / KCTC 23876 / PAT) TaxID=550540 RepID=E1SNC3_FERBD|nr:DUF308 domain-containing protein [Ferrimonas balearica]ADN74622.1 conserved hypothetical protein [Ferrimonas balearica DSM 9799]MBW3140434.1 DUF308 domain-containing protein [Ferrimonas balearica]MBY5981203.1 DUF308 domain-containing protein [Ferrimonas balearica]MBY6107751.1 DUF308 domain-containing protein [Ferrimonas balearica]MBY6225758.1 DUF308 domain-containing protein [Ferrimonas balearica]
MIKTTLDAALTLGRRSGIFLLILGILSVAMPWATGLALEMLLGILLLCAGVAQLFFAFRTRELSGFPLRLVFGLLTSFAGLYLLFNPTAGVVAITLILGIYFLIDGLATLLASFQYRAQRNWLMMFANGAVTLALAAVILWQWPASGRYVIGILVGIKLIMMGLMMITTAGMVSAAKDRMDAVRAQQRADGAKVVDGEDRTVDP